jgi:hypothetical protein
MDMVVHTCHPSYNGKNKTGGLRSTGLGEKQDSSSKTNRAKRGEDTARMAEGLLSKCKALSSNPSTKKKKNAI